MGQAGGTEKTADSERTQARKHKPWTSAIVVILVFGLAATYVYRTLWNHDLTEDVLAIAPEEGDLESEVFGWARIGEALGRSW